jgi:hypothetical protein
MTTSSARAAAAAAATAARATAAGEVRAAKMRPHATPPGPPVIRNQSNYIHFFAESSVGGSTVSTSLTLLAGDTRPQPTDGYAQVTTVALPLARGLTVFTGYNPVSLALPVRFIKFDRSGSWLKDAVAGNDIETGIADLEWMAGSGNTSGRPPFVYLSTYDATGRTISLIPKQYQSVSVRSAGKRWLITGLDWGDSWSNAGMDRIRQDVTVTVQRYETVTGGYTRLLPRPKSIVVKSAAGFDTALLIARAQKTADAPNLAYDIVHAIQNAPLHLRGINQKIKFGRGVVVPSSSLQAVDAER